MKIKDWLKVNRNIFSECDLRYLIKNTFTNTTYPFIEEDILSADKLDYLDRVKGLYLKDMPLAYILEKEEFFGWEFKVNPSVLIPRKETELIVEKTIEAIINNNFKNILDLGCGSGNIAISLKKIFNKKINVFASDISLEALILTKRNIQAHNTDVKLIETDLLKGFKNNFFDLIVSNPPYVDSKLIKGSLEYEPKRALEADKRGMHFIEKIIAEAKFYLKKEGYLIMEIGYDQKERVDNLVRMHDYQIIDWIKDYSGHWRGIILKSKFKSQNAK